MNLMNQDLSVNEMNSQFHPSIRAGVGLARQTLLQYYELIQKIPIYWIAMGEFINVYLHV